MKRKIHAVNITVYVEQEGRPALPTRQEITDGLIASLAGDPVDVQYGADSYGAPLTQTAKIVGVYSKLSGVPSNQKGPDLSELRATPRSE
jgi:hypothetical protein